MKFREFGIGKNCCYPQLLFGGVGHQDEPPDSKESWCLVGSTRIIGEEQGIWSSDTGKPTMKC